jgi:hypothetical protein
VAALLESGLQEREPVRTAAPLDSVIAVPPVSVTFALHAALTPDPGLAGMHVGPLSTIAAGSATLLIAGAGLETAEKVAICITQAPAVYNVAVAL